MQLLLAGIALQGYHSFQTIGKVRALFQVALRIGICSRAAEAKAVAG